MKFLSAHPDEPYFMWQLQVQLSNFARLGIESDLIVLLGVRDKPSPAAQYIKANTTAQVHFIPDERQLKVYAPSIQFHLYSKFFETNKIGEPYMLIDSDVIFDSVPLLHRLIEDDVIYMSDCKGYLGYEYVKSKGQSQMDQMASMIGITSQIIQENDVGAGGAQTIMKGFEDAAFWKKVEYDSVMLYQFMARVEPEWRGEGYAIQKWTAGMWSFLWNLWRWKATTRVVPEMDFCWGSDPVEKRKPIIHLAGVTPDMAGTHFYKGAYVNMHPFDDESLGCQPVQKSMADVYVCDLLDAKREWNDIRIRPAG